MGPETTSWFESTAESPNSRTSTEYALSHTVSITSNQSVAVEVINAIVETIEPQRKQTSLNLYEHVNPDALKEIIDTSTTKKSDVEVRFTFEDHLIAVRSNDTIRIYKPLEKQHEADRQLGPAP
ncbi:HalOD1 output domain-containing protein [Haladaptatus sp. DYF46]|uniref:HalOD1 output domain-containing protein n=1 Tax=Haladaptatus sp. DYF46 TaxID=2886041 RepID=UPI001E3D0588|nr:HalOD1 output domain-containing protein [Haladaptatus sp. DYF46]